jgi:chromate transporter
MLIMLALAWVYSRFAASSVIAGALHGVRPVVVGLIAWALIDLGRRIVLGPFLALVGLVVMVAALFGANPIILLALGGFAIVLRRSLRLKPFAPGLAAASVAMNTSLLGIFLVFLKYGAISFGSGYVLFAFLQTDVVQTYHWLTTQQLVDAIAISQATPGPVFTVATFIGGFVLVPFLDRIVRLVNAHPWAKAFLEGVNVGALGLIAAVAVQLGRAALVDPITGAIALVSFGVLLRVPLAAPALMIAGGVVGVLLLR